MHLGNGAITPGCAAITFAIAGAGLGLAAASIRRTKIDRDRWLTAGALTGSIFAAQMVNVPVLPFSSGHLVGGVLAAWVLGPPLGAMAMAVVVMTQALILGDGGFIALGANIINMGLLPALAVWVVRRRNSTMAAGLTASVAVVIAAVLILAESALFRSADQLVGFGSFSLKMHGIHLWIAVPEGILTVAILKVLGGIRSPGELRLDQTRLAGCWGMALLLVLCLLPCASPMPDGYETAAVQSGMERLLTEDSHQLATIGSINATIADFQDQVVLRVQAAIDSEQLVALLATGFAGLIVCWIARGLGNRLHQTV
jgi:cobalt/nickel transport system permease protein